jgi:hypothetical protein
MQNKTYKTNKRRQTVSKTKEMAIELTEQLLAQIDGYLKGSLSISESDAFKKRLLNEPELQEEVRLQQQLFDTLGTEEWHTIHQTNNKERLAALKSKIRSKEYQDLSANIRNAEVVYFNDQKNTGTSFRKYYRYIAAAAAIILFFGIYVTQMNSSYSSYYENHVDWSTELPSFVEKGQEKNAFLEGEIAFKQEKYNEAITFFQKVTPTDELYTSSLVYLGASYDILDQNEKAIATFKKLANVDDEYERSRGNWYLAMIHLKMENKDKAIEALQKNAKDVNSHKYDEAKILLRKLE